MNPRPRTPRSATAVAPAKVNVQLAVGGLRPDGFHDLANVFLAVDIWDRVTASEAAEPGVSCTGPDAALVPLDSTNLAWRAAELLAAHHGRRPDVRLHIDKDIPVAGGMAGGSADAAAALVACDALWDARTPRADLLKLGAELGSDVPFALVGGAALGRGRGEVLTPLPVSGAFHWVFATADGGLSTPDVYRECDRLRGDRAAAHDRPEPEPAPGLLAALAAGDAVALAGAVANDLQPAALSLRPQLAATLTAGSEAGALAALVSGSGPTCAFLAADATAAEAVAAALAGSGTCRAARATTGPAGAAALAH